MRRVENDPLSVALWLSELADLSAFCAVGSPGEEDRAVRRAFHLFKLSTPSVRSLADPYLAESALELALEHEGPEAATRLIAGKRASFTLARPRPGQPPVAVEMSFDEGPPVRGEGTSAVYAMVGAWANFFRTVH